MTKQELLNGTRFIFDNENWCIENESDDIRSAEVWFDNGENHKRQWGIGFKIWFNGMLIHSCKTFSSLDRKLNSLCGAWNLELKVKEKID